MIAIESTKNKQEIMRKWKNCECNLCTLVDNQNMRNKY